MEDETQALYLQEGCFHPENECDVHPFDPFTNVQWPLIDKTEWPTLSQKDHDAPNLSGRMDVPSQPRQRILVIGATGQLGSAIVEAYGAENCIGTYCNTKTNDAYVHFDMMRALEEKYTEFLFDLVQPTCVYVCTGMTWVDGCEQEVDKCTLLNHTAPVHVAKVAQAFGCKFVWYSTDYVFDGKEGPYNEYAPVNPLNQYGRSKRNGELGIMSTCDGALVLRINGVYGPEELGKNFVYQVADRRAKRVPSDQFGTPTYSRDIARVSQKLVESNAKGIVHVTGDEVLSRVAFAKRIASVLGLEDECTGVETTQLQQSATRPLHGGLQSRRLQTFVPDWKFMSIEEALEDWRSHPRSRPLQATT